ncbi:EAL domain-containing protein [Massilia sp. TW-1]|uniref:EAL domain-containing protein n=1 Tax=Telluria antibiotica TaxID=2717319 RepID=A0ABX0PF02_9BURK|nr:EAL domain-containing protein [Telluria antibiotica]NIA55074.1 EAL domain-containing protein [Telluria antibiotica]
MNTPFRIDRICIALLCCFLFVAEAGIARAALPALVRVGVYDNSPKLFVDGNGHAAGILIDLLDKTAAAEGWTVQYVPCTWAACVAQLARGEIDLLPDVAYTEERARMFAFHDVPALLSWSQLYRGGRVKVASIVDLRDKRIAVLDGSVQAAYLTSLLGAYGLTPRFVVAPSFDEAFRLVRDGKADLAAANNFYGDVHAQQYGLSATPIVFMPTRLFYAARPGLPPAFHAALDRHLRAWQADSDSVYFAVLKRWQLEGPAQRINERTAWLLLLSATLLVVAVAAALRFRGQAAHRARALRDTENNLSLILNSVDSLVYIKDADFRYRYVNDALCRMLGLSAAEILGKDDFALFEPGLAAELRAHDLQAMTAAEPLLFEESVVLDGARRAYLSTKMALALGDGGARSLCGVSSDVTSRKRMEESVRIAATVFESHEGMLVLDRTRAVIDANAGFCAMSGYGRDELLGERELPFRLEQGGCDLDASFWEAVDSEHKWHGSAYSRRKDATPYPVLLTISAVPDDDGHIANYVCTVSDITELKQVQERNQRLAYYDDLTGLPNRRLLFERIHACVAASRDEPQVGALLFLDLDNFKDLNDTRGHSAGDQLLLQVAQRVGACVRAGDTVARVGGDEFVVMLDAVGTNDEEARLHAEVLAEKVLAVVAAPYVIDGLPHHASCSIGVTLCAHSHEALDTLMKRGDLAMYQAKADGRNVVRFFETWMEDAVARRTRLEGELREALATGQFELYYQPQVEGDRVVGAEALLRWHHPRRGLIGPVEFIPVAESTDLILPMGAWVLRAACEQLARWKAAPHSAHLTVAVNISIRQLMEDNFVRDTLAIIAATGADAGCLKLELTESMVIEGVEETIAKMEALRRHGVRFLLDDFGTGYSSLAYLKRLPLEQLKIDRSFVRDILVDPNDASIARSIVALAQALGLSIIAEGVETAAQRDKLLELGCPRFQGYLYGRPMPVADFDDLVVAPVTQ